MKRTTILINVFMLLSMLLVACTPSVATEAPGSEEVEETEEVTKKVGLVLPTLQYEFFVNIADGMQEILEDAGYEFTAMSFDGDANKLVSIIENFTIEHVDVIVAMVSDNSADSVLQEAIDQGIYVVEAGVLTDAYTIGLVADNEDVGNKIAEMAADYVNNELGGTADVVAIISQSSADMATRSDAMLEKFAELAPNAIIVGTTEYDGVGSATAAVENFLQQYPDIKVVMSFGDSGAIEAIEVMKAANKTEGFAAFGCDATEHALQLIAEGNLMGGTVDMGDIITQMVEPTLSLLEGDTSLPKVIVGENVKVTDENIDDYID